MTSLHSNSSFLTLDVSLFNPLSNFYSQNLDSWMETSGGIVNISKRYFYDYSGLLGSVHC